MVKNFKLTRQEGNVIVFHFNGVVSEEAKTIMDADFMEYLNSMGPINDTEDDLKEIEKRLDTRLMMLVAAREVFCNKGVWEVVTCGNA
jgi:hypothetical protein